MKLSSCSIGKPVLVESASNKLTPGHVVGFTFNTKKKILVTVKLPGYTSAAPSVQGKWLKTFEADVEPEKLTEMPENYVGENFF